MEQDFSKVLRMKWRTMGVVIDRIETNATCIGIPDIFAVDMKVMRSAFIETKYSKNIPTKVTYERGQADWLQSRSKYGVRCCTLLYCEEGRQVYYIPGSDSKVAEKSIADVSFFVVSLLEKDAWRELLAIVFLA